MNSKGEANVSEAVGKLIEARGFGDPSPAERQAINQAIDEAMTAIKGPSEFGGFK